MLDRRGLSVLVAIAAGVAPFGCRGREGAQVVAPVAAPAPAAPSPAPARRPPPPEPFTHPLLAQAERPITHEDCSRGALWAVAQQIRGMHKQVARSAHEPGKRTTALAGGCQPPALADMAKVVRGPLQERVGGCVGRDGPYDPEWDMVNSGVLSLGVCLDCSRSREQRAGDCKHALEAVDRAQKAAQKGTAEQRAAQEQTVGAEKAR